MIFLKLSLYIHFIIYNTHPTPILLTPPTLLYLLVMEYYCAKRNNELEEFHVNWNDLQVLAQSERRTLYTETDTLWHNPM